MNANRIALLVVVALAALWTCTFTVQESETALVTRFGGVQRTVDEAGLQWKLPVDRVVRVDRRVRVLELDAGELLTNDPKNIEVSAFLAWTVAEPEKFVRSALTVERAEASLKGYLDTKVTEVLAQRPMTDLIGIPGEDAGGPALDAVNAELLAAVAEPARRDLGVDVTTARLLRIGFPLQNKSSVYDRMAAERNGQAAAIRAEAQREATRIKNEASERNQQIVTAAKTEAERIRGRAEAEAAEVLRSAAEANPEFFDWLLTQELWRDALGEDDVIVLEVPEAGPLRDLLEGRAPERGGGQ